MTQQTTDITKPDLDVKQREKDQDGGESDAAEDVPVGVAAQHGGRVRQGEWIEPRRVGLQREGAHPLTPPKQGLGELVCGRAVGVCRKDHLGHDRIMQPKPTLFNRSAERAGEEAGGAISGTTRSR